MFTPDVVWSLALCAFCLMMLSKKRSMKMLFLAVSLILIIGMRIQGTI